MGDNKFDNRISYQQRESDRYSFSGIPNNVVLDGFKRINRMATSKALMTFLTWLGIPSTLLGMFAHMDATKATILYIAGLTMIVIRFSLWVYRVIQGNKLKAMELKERELDFVVKQQEMKQREIDQLERQLELRIALLNNDQKKDGNNFKN